MMYSDFLRELSDIAKRHGVTPCLCRDELGGFIVQFSDGKSTPLMRFSFKHTIEEIRKMYGDN